MVYLLLTTRIANLRLSFDKRYMANSGFFYLRSDFLSFKFWDQVTMMMLVRSHVTCSRVMSVEVIVTVHNYLHHAR